ncbi:hypothetical protein K488DRAFT_51303, partial [Vararia minispora EC-137]
MDGSREYELSVRQQPKQARMCGVGGVYTFPSLCSRAEHILADRRPIDPPPIVQLRVIEKGRRELPSPSPSPPPQQQQAPPGPAPPDGKTRCTTGSVVSSLYHLKDSENDNRDAGFFVFPDLSVRQEGSYRLKLSLFEVVG